MYEILGIIVFVAAVIRLNQGVALWKILILAVVMLTTGLFLRANGIGGPVLWPLVIGVTGLLFLRPTKALHPAPQA